MEVVFRAFFRINFGILSLFLMGPFCKNAKNENLFAHFSDNSAFLGQFYMPDYHLLVLNNDSMVLSNSLLGEDG